MTTTNTTRRQHYVPQAYLRHWCNDSGKLAAYVDGEVLPACGTKNFAVEVDFYAFIDLSADELGFLYKIISQILEDTNPIVSIIVVPIFLNILYFRCEKHDWSEKYGEIYDKFFPWMKKQEHVNLYRFLRKTAVNNAELKSEYVAAIKSETTSGFEGLMTGIENSAWPVINALLTNGAKCLNEGNNLRCLLLFLLNQCFRGPDYLRHIEAVLPERMHEIGETPKLAKYLRYLFPFYILNQLSQTKDQRKVHVIVNKTDLEFITGDVPCIIYGEKRNPKTPIITFFPMSPRRALLFGYRESINTYIQEHGWELIDRSLVDWFNREVAASSQRFIFASRADILKDNDYMVYVGRTPSYVR